MNFTKNILITIGCIHVFLVCGYFAFCKTGKDDIYYILGSVASFIIGVMAVTAHPHIEDDDNEHD